MKIKKTLILTFIFLLPYIKANALDKEVNIKLPVNTLVLTNEIKEDILKQIDDIKVEDLDLEKTLISGLDTLDLKSPTHLKANLLIKPVLKSNFNSLVAKTISTEANIDVVDVSAPVVEFNKKTVVLGIDSEFDPWKYVDKTYDDIDEEPIIIVKNDVDTSEAGKYSVTFVTNDKSNNRAEYVLNVTVNNYKFSGTGASLNPDSILAMLELINNERANLGLNPLNLADDLGQSAVSIRAEEASSYVAHKRPDGRHYKTAFDDIGATYANHPLEVLTYAGSKVEDKFNWWMNSTGHRNILMSGGNYSTIAIGYYGEMWCAIVY